MSSMRFTPVMCTEEYKDLSSSPLQFCMYGWNLLPSQSFQSTQNTCITPGCSLHISLHGMLSPSYPSLHSLLLSLLICALSVWKQLFWYVPQKHVNQEGCYCGGKGTEFTGRKQKEFLRRWRKEVLGQYGLVLDQRASVQKGKLPHCLSKKKKKMKIISNIYK